MAVYLLLGLCSAVLALLMTPLVSQGSIRLGLVDAPGGRKVHPQSVPRLGGVAVVAATMLAMILVDRWGPRDFDPAIWRSLRPFGAAGLLIFGVGRLDDVRGVAPLPKLAVPTIAIAGRQKGATALARPTGRSRRSARPCDNCWNPAASILITGCWRSDGRNGEPC